MPVPLPAELAVERPPLSDYDLDQVTTDILAHADESGLTPGEILASFLNGDGTVAIGPEPARRFRVTDLGSAEWAMRMVAEAAAEEAALAAQREEWTTRIGAWFVQASRPLAARQAFFNAHLEAYALAERARDANRKTVSVPSGKVRTTAKQPKVVVTDEPTVITWARANLDEEVLPTVVKVTESVLLTGLREVAEIQSMQIATRYTAELACGHTLIVVTEDRAETVEERVQAAPWGQGERVACAVPGGCNAEWTAIARITTEPVTVLVSSVPGTAVEEEAVTAKVAPGA